MQGLSNSTVDKHRACLVESDHKQSLHCVSHHDTLEEVIRHVQAKWMAPRGTIITNSQTMESYNRGVRSRPVYPLRIIECDIACWVEEICVRDFVKEKFVDEGLEFRALI
ncbi:hypothetical protein KCU62_g355, partial [Aureobasidium sp. EXF-3399]